MNIQQTAKSLFKKVFKVSGIVTVSLIKKQFPNFKSSVSDSWQLLILKLLKRNSRANKTNQLSNTERVMQAVAWLSAKGIYQIKKDSLMGLSVRLGFDKVLLGNIGYSNIRQSFFYSICKGVPRFVDSINEAVTCLLQYSSFNYLNQNQEMV